MFSVKVVKPESDLENGRRNGDLKHQQIGHGFDSKHPRCMPFGQSRIPVGLQKPDAHSIGCELLTAAWSAFKKKLHCPSNLKSIPLSALRSLCKNLFKDQSCQFRDQSKGVRLCHSSPKLTMLIGALQIQMSFPSARTNVCITSTKSVQ